MAHAIRLGYLTDELITIVTGFSVQDDSKKFNVYRDSALRTLKNGNYARTNQFDVEHQLEGLEEKFRVYNKDNIADALRVRLDELESRSSRWTPEILHLLLELSDKPIVNSSLEELEFLRPPEEHVEPQYKWEDLVAEDPLLRDKHVWRNIDYTADSSDDEEASWDSDHDFSNVTETTSLSSNHDIYRRQPEDFAVPADPQKLAILEMSQFWRQSIVDEASIALYTKEEIESKRATITEVQAVCEILFLLSGLPTSLFETRLEQNTSSSGGVDLPIPAKDTLLTRKGSQMQKIVTPVARFKLQHCSHQIFQEALVQFAEYGNSIGLLRSWARTKEAIPLLQSVQNEVMIRLRRFDSQLSDLEKRYISPLNDVVVSIAETQVEVSQIARPFLRLSNLFKQLSSRPHSHAFHCLELLYDETCNSQTAGDDYMYEFMGTMFFDCLQVYLRPIRRWMEEGELPRDNNAVFVAETKEDVELASIWNRRYKLLKTPDDGLHAPKFLHPASNKIFAAGKSVVVLKHLGRFEHVKHTPIRKEPKLDFKTVCDPETLAFAPFSELFDIAFERWIESKHHETSSILRQCLFDNCGLGSSLNALEKIYFMADGAASSNLANGIFEKLDSGKSSWNDRFTLTELARATIGSLPNVTAERLRASITIIKHMDVQRARKSVKPLNTITFTYNLPWPVQIIVTKDVLPSYHKIFTFLLQIRRSIHVLHCTRHKLTDDEADELGAYYKLRSRLLWFNTTLYSYLTDLVIQMNTLQMHEALAKGEDIDQMIEVHRTYMKRMIDQALLGMRLELIHKSIITVLDLSIQLSDARSRQNFARGAKDATTDMVQGLSLNRPKRQFTAFGQQRPSHRKESDSSDGEDSDQENKPQSTHVAETRLSYAEELRNMLSQFDRLCRFVATGLRGVARAGGEPNWDMLADKLESGMGFGV